MELQATLLGGGTAACLVPEEAEKAAAQDGLERAWAHWISKLKGK